MATAIVLQTEVCCVCRGKFNDDRVSSGHFRATDNYGAYVCISAAWHEGCGGDDGRRLPLRQEPDAEWGCFGLWEEWMGVRLESSYASPFDPKRRRDERP
jgi:hypothetical protein